ncbi:hypothetical protein DAPPUDRAFT_329247 [Daphnia pulex]|uniref:Uncharacterized protein n=1 Tax=Daphnia pulex TaxID=6669 RepID=E9HG24_DAPPU|nr:hypothetical protein DAPPUDRAFT_329247 [Daphnia pulex]|eukprot:EFX69332.1 hypothetical protein DAPPUDRAFT_329247 [Daphnia pulex]
MVDEKNGGVTPYNETEAYAEWRNHLKTHNPSMNIQIRTIHFSPLNEKVKKKNFQLDYYSDAKLPEFEKTGCVQEEKECQSHLSDGDAAYAADIDEFKEKSVVNVMQLGEERRVTELLGSEGLGSLILKTYLQTKSSISNLLPEFAAMDYTLDYYRCAKAHFSWCLIYEKHLKYRETSDYEDQEDKEDTLVVESSEGELSCGDPDVESGNEGKSDFSEECEGNIS